MRSPQIEALFCMLFSEAGIFSGELRSLQSGRYILGARAIERRDFHRYNSRAAVKLGDRNFQRHRGHL